ncbi:PaaI family thioesterase [Ilumatobacter sp.]|uniref:PaaI family thioesterase n=1 Tax=Ilumatobacter sp. TaxID=1967498 RepID=UPI003B52E661
MSDFDPGRAERFALLDSETNARWEGFGASGETTFPMLLGVRVEEVRADYCRMRLPFRTELLQAAGLLHGGAMASLLDHVVVPAVGAQLAQGVNYSTVDMHVQFLRGVVAGEGAEDVVAEGWVVRRGRRTVFCEAEAFGGTTGKLLAKSVLTYAVSAPAS